jgi:hypothetical protein
MSINAAKGVDVTRQNDDNSARNEWQSAKTALANAKQDYDSKAEAAEVAWAAIQNSSRSLDEQLGKAQQRLAEAVGLTAAVALPSPAPATPALNPAAAEAALVHGSRSRAKIGRRRISCLRSMRRGCWA